MVQDAVGMAMLGPLVREVAALVASAAAGIAARGSAVEESTIPGSLVASAGAAGQERAGGALGRSPARGTAAASRAAITKAAGAVQQGRSGHRPGICRALSRQRLAGRAAGAVRQRLARRGPGSGRALARSRGARPVWVYAPSGAAGAPLRRPGQLGNALRVHAAAHGANVVHDHDALAVRGPWRPRRSGRRQPATHGFDVRDRARRPVHLRRLLAERRQRLSIAGGRLLAWGLLRL
mmetsp:Transcript_28350/g.90175  ORF Transcript_28350/g.90175 Transcript_28350/m.90175 type:complete len:237 (+) Transcript_28350:231-941(+)